MSFTRNFFEVKKKSGYVMFGIWLGYEDQRVQKKIEKKKKYKINKETPRGACCPAIGYYVRSIDRIDEIRKRKRERNSSCPVSSFANFFGS